MSKKPTNKRANRNMKRLRIGFTISSLLVFIISNSAISQSIIEPNSILIGADQINMVDGDTIFFWNQARNAFRGGVYKAQDVSNTNVGQHSFAYGFENEATANQSIAMGGSNKAQGDYSVAMGLGNVTTGGFAISLGNQNHALSQSSVALGNRNVINFSYGIALGDSLVVNDQHMVAVGTFNENMPQAQDWFSRPIFVVGNGDGRDIGRSNAMTVLFDGKTGLRTTSPESELHLVHQDSSKNAGIRIENEKNGRWWRFFAGAQNNLALFNSEFGSGIVNIGLFNSSGAYSNTSDRRYKKNIIDLPYGLEDVLKLSPKRYQFKHVEDRLDIGLIAQDVLEVIPELVSYDKDGEKYMLNYDGFAVLSIKAIQELHQVVEEKSATIKNQQTLIDDLINRVEQLEGSK